MEFRRGGTFEDDEKIEVILSPTFGGKSPCRILDPRIFSLPLLSFPFLFFVIPAFSLCHSREGGNPEPCRMICGIALSHDVASEFLDPRTFSSERKFRG